MKAIIKTILENESLYNNLELNLTTLEKDILRIHYINNLTLLEVANHLSISFSWCNEKHNSAMKKIEPKIIYALLVFRKPTKQKETLTKEHIAFNKIKNILAELEPKTNEIKVNSFSESEIENVKNENIDFKLLSVRITQSFKACKFITNLDILNFIDEVGTIKRLRNFGSKSEKELQIYFANKGIKI
jgi:hypothetical protein